ncbi:MAG TPA: HAMP domain-containing protein [Bryobacteraceae bacterium]|nr:HAMP domain-containing protein [Bryobacteraceae bacterium]
MSSYGAKLQAAFVLLGLVAVGITGWESSVTAGNALREATYERLTAIAATRRREVERYFRDAGNHVLALSSDESSIRALEEFEVAWPAIPPLPPDQLEPLRRLYSGVPANWFPKDPRTQTLQTIFVASNPHPNELRYQLVSGPGAGKYSATHAQYHPTLQRYQSAFGFYDTFLVGARERRVLYTVTKEIDLGVSLRERPYDKTSLARLIERAMALPEPEMHVVEDYEPYLPSRSAPAAFFGAPVWRGGAKIGVLAIQISVDELNRVMTGGGNWEEEGLGKTGQAYILGPDNKLRSDLRSTVPPEVATSIRSGERGTHLGRDLNNVPVLRSHTPLTIPGLNWTLIAEIKADEALQPVAGLRTKVLLWGAGIALFVFAAASLLARSVTRPVLALARNAARIGRGDFEAILPVHSNDELGQLAASFNQMAKDLQRTTVSKEELEVLASRLITATEDERTRIARELHDDLSQRLAAAAIELGRLQRVVPDHRDEIARVKDQVVDLSEDVHGLSRRLHTSTLDDIGLVAAVETECRSFFERGGPPVAFSAEGEFDALGHDVQLALYRIVQEALRNIQRHSLADEVSVRLLRTSDEVELEIKDNGRGFDLGDRTWRRGVGLASMEERANLLNGRCTIEAKSGEGVRINVRVKAQSATGGRS